MADVITKIGIKDATGTGFDSRDIGAKGQNIEIGYDNNDKIILDVDTTTPVSTKTLTSVLQTDDTLIANLNTSKAPNKHNWTASESVDYGKADATHFGHIRPGTGLYVDSDASSATYGSTNVSFASNKEVAANKAVQGNDSRLSDARKNPNAITFNSTGGAALGTTYDGSAARTIDYSTVGAAPISHTSIQGGESTLGHVKAGTGLSASSGVLSVKYGTASGTACAGNDSRLSDNRTPKSHASATAITYGAGTDEQYGHVMLSDTYSVETPSKDDSGAAVSLGASAYALQTAYNSLSSSVSSLNSNLGTLQSDVSSLNTNLANLSSTVGGMKNLHATYSSFATVNLTTSMQDIVTLTAPESGEYLVLVNFLYNNTGSKQMDLEWRIKNKNTGEQHGDLTVYVASVGSPTGRFGSSSEAFFTASKGDIFALQISATATGGTINMGTIRYMKMI